MKITKMLLKAGADVNAKHQGDSLLYNALINKYLLTEEKDENKIDPFKFLLDHGANINDGENRDSSSLIYAVYQSDPEITEFLLKRGANINSTLEDTNDFASIMLGRPPRRYTLYQIAKGKPEIITILNKYSKQKERAIK